MNINESPPSGGSEGGQIMMQFALLLKDWNKQKRKEKETEKDLIGSTRRKREGPPMEVQGLAHKGKRQGKNKLVTHAGLSCIS